MKLLTLLKALRKEEYRDFEKFLQSPFFKASDQYLTFFRYLNKQFPTFELEREGLEFAFRSCFGAKSFTETKLYNLMSGMSKQVEQYLAIQLVLNQDERNGLSLQRYLLVKALGERNMSSYYRAAAEELVALTESLQAKSSDNYLAIYLLNRDYYFNPDTPKHLDQQPALQSATDSLIIHFCISFLRLVAEMHVRGRSIKGLPDLSRLVLDAVLAYTDHVSIRDKSPLAAIYNSLVKMYHNGVSEHGFRDIKELLVENFDQLPKQEQRLLMSHVINSGISMYASEANVNQELLSLYKLAITYNALLEGNRITHIAFFNIAATAAYCSEFDWALEFVAEYRKFLEFDKELSAVSLSKALVCYENGNLENARSFFDNVVFRTSGFEMIGRLLHLKITFDNYLKDADEFQFLSHTLSTFERYVKEKQSLTFDKKETILNFIRFVNHLTKERTSNPNLPMKAKTRLRKKLDGIPYIVSRDWLHKRIDSL
ncbi:MAG: hypothetical protein IPN76_28670 [Saprospiraceae bacterium]|nr:hypothetical protein [Saprospiraceae bacterium]